MQNQVGEEQISPPREASERLPSAAAGLLSRTEITAYDEGDEAQSVNVPRDLIMEKYKIRLVEEQKSD